jgi:hypothetical protein
MVDGTRGLLAIVLALIALAVAVADPTAWFPAIGLAVASMLISPPPP